MSTADSTDRASLRIPAEQLAEIDRLWRAHGFPNRTEYMIAAALRFQPAADETARWREDVEVRLDRLEHAQFT